MTLNAREAAWLQSSLSPTGLVAPFPWQCDLLARFLQGSAPAALDIPTGLGKTAVMAIWLVARASGAPVPRRLVYVVDRRAVVDQATEVAERLRRWVADSPEVKRALGIEADRALPISTLRGQFVDNKEWLEDPSSPAIILGTVDMIGSRLLFGGYGVSQKMRPYQAGLLGADALLVLDEAHLVPPFERLIEQVASGRDAANRSLDAREEHRRGLVPRLRVLSLSATGREREESEVFRLGPADRENDEVRRRLSAVKRLSVRPVVADKELPEALAAEAWKLSREGGEPTRVVVFVTSRDHAQKVRETLDALAAKAKRPVATELFVGGRRIHERQLAATWLDQHGFIPASQRTSEMAAFLVATAAGEVGVDFDANHAVCDLVAWERMVQRLGRVNRRGRVESEIVVVPCAVKEGHDSEMRSALRGVLEVLSRRDDGTADVSPGALAALKADPAIRQLLDRASTPAPLHPPLTRAIVESWSMTSLDEHTGRPEVAPWIRGWPDEAEEPQTTVVWRKYLPLDATGDLLNDRDLETFWDAAAPHLAERLETETWRVVEWLSKRLKELESSKGDDEETDRFARPLRSSDAVALIVRPGGEVRIVRGDELSNKAKREAVARELSGATLMADRRLGGLVRGLLAAHSDELVDDITELDIDQSIVPFRVRLAGTEDDDPENDAWRIEASVPVAKVDAKTTEWLVIESLAAVAAQSEEGRSGAKRAQRLDEHEKWAEVEVVRIAERLGVPSEYMEMLATAAYLHDEGKRAERWQRAFKAPNGGNPPLAKTVARPNVQLLEGYRHELGSLPYAESDERVKRLAPELRDLCLHLIAAHHGNARPVLRTSGAPEPPSRLVARAQEIALRFARLEKTWGPWGLAWWEALLRAADQRASRRNDLEAHRG